MEPGDTFEGIACREWGTKPFDARFLRDVPADRLLVETDCPYLAPVPVRGKRNEPAYVAHTAALLAEVRGVPADELAAQATRNARALFAVQ